MSSKQIPDETIDAIRLDHLEGYTHGQLVKKYGVSIAHVGRILRGEVRTDGMQIRTRDELTRLRRNPNFEGKMKRDAALSQERLMALVQSDPQLAAMVGGLPPASETPAPEPVAVQHLPTCEIARFGARACSCVKMAEWQARKKPLEKPPE
jgi:hypothetical protein